VNKKIAPLFSGAIFCPRQKLRFIVFSAPKAQKLLPGEKLAKIFDF
jgi:hypothetical protein